MPQEKNTEGYKEALLIMPNSVCISEYVFKILFLKKGLKHCPEISKLLMHTSELFLCVREEPLVPPEANDVISLKSSRLKTQEEPAFLPQGQVMASVHVESRQRGRVPSSSGSSSGFVLFRPLNFHIKDGDLST